MSIFQKSPIFRGIFFSKYVIWMITIKNTTGYMYGTYIERSWKPRSTYINRTSCFFVQPLWEWHPLVVPDRWIKYSYTQPILRMRYNHCLHILLQCIKITDLNHVIINSTKEWIRTKWASYSQFHRFMSIFQKSPIFRGIFFSKYVIWMITIKDFNTL
jgi:hypothetical protein